MKLEGATEENILTILCFDPKHSSAVALELKPELFSTRAYREIAQAAFSHLNEFRQPPRLHLRDILEAKIRKGDEGALIAQTIDAMSELEKDIQPDYVLSTMKAFVRKRRIKMALEAASDLADADDLDKAEETLYAGMGHNGGPDAGTWLSDTNQMMSHMQDEDEDGFSCAIDALDDRGVTLARKTSTLLIAPAKRGKSWWLVNVGKRGILAGKKVLHITLENSEKLTARRYCQSLFAMTKSEAKQVRNAIFQKDNLGRMTRLEMHEYIPEGLKSTGRARIMKRLRQVQRRGSLHIKEFPTGTLTAAQLNAYLDHLKLAKRWQPDIMIIDYPDLMKTEGKDERISLGKLFKEIRGIFVERNCAGAIVTQGNRQSSGAKTVTERHVAEDYSKIGSADTVLTYSQTAEEKQMGLARILVSNARDAEDSFIVLCSQQYTTGQFAIDSVYMNKFVETEMQRFTGTGDGEPAEEDE